MAFDEVISALGEGTLQAQDYYGMTPEQISALMQKGSDDRKMVANLAMDVRRQELDERKQAFEELRQNRMFELMQKQDAREEFKMLMSQGMDIARTQLERKKLSLDAARVNSAIATDAMQRKKLDYEYQMLKRNEEALSTMTDKYLPVPGMTDDEGEEIKMSIGELFATGMLPSVLKANQDKFVSSSRSSGGISKQVELREYMSDVAKELGASKHFQNIIKLMGPEAMKNMGPGAIRDARMKYDPLFALDTKSVQEEKVKQDMEFLNLYQIRLGGKIASDNAKAAPAYGDLESTAPSKQYYVTPSEEDHIRALLEGD